MVKLGGAHLCVIICILLALAGAVTGSRTVIADYTPSRKLLPCLDDSMCSAEQVCSRGICLTRGMVGLDRIPASVGSATLVGFLIGFGFCVSMLALGPFVCCPIRFDHMEDGDLLNATCLIMISFVGGTFLAVSSGVLYGSAGIIPVVSYQGDGETCIAQDDPTCGAFLCDVTSAQCFTACSYDSECSEGFKCEGGDGSTDSPKGTCQPGSNARNVRGVSQKTAPAGVAVLVAVFFGCLCGSCAFVAAYKGDLDEVLDKEDIKVPASFCAFSCCFLIVALALGVPIGLTNRAVTFDPNFNLDLNDTCQANLECSPYMCDTTTGLCRNACKKTFECAEGFECLQSMCVWDNKKAGIKTTYSVGSLIGIGVGVVFGYTCACGGMIWVRLTIKDAYDKEEDCVAGTSMCFMVSLAIAAAIVVPLAVGGRNVKFENYGLGEACSAVDASVCYPYYCDMRNGLCQASCSSDSECREGSSCVSSACRVDSKDIPQPPPAKFQGYFMTVVILASVIVVAIGVLALGLRQIRQIHWYANIGAIIDTFGESEEIPAKTAASLACSVLCATIVGVTLLLVFRGLNKKAEPPMFAPSLTSFNSSGLVYSSVNASEALEPPPPCSGVYEPRCSPYICSTNAGLCTKSCGGDDGCALSAVCLDGQCVDVIKAGALPAPWLLFAKVVGSVGAFLFSVTFCGVLVGGCSPFRRLMYGIQLERMPFVICCALSFFPVVLVFVFQPLNNITKVILPDFEGDATEHPCTYLNDVSCAPYFCDLRVSGCFTECMTDDMCGPGFQCSDSACVAYDPSPMRTAVRSTIGAVCALLVLVSLYPFVYRTVFNWRTKRAADRAARVKAADEAAATQLANLKRDHPVFIDVIPASVHHDPSVISPAAWVVDPDASGDIFEKQIDKALADAAPTRHSGEFPDVAPPDMDPQEAAKLGLHLPPTDVDSPFSSPPSSSHGGASTSTPPVLAAPPVIVAVQPVGMTHLMPAQPVAPAVRAAPTTWNCSMCTFINEIADLRCVVCEQGERPGQLGLGGGDVNGFINAPPPQSMLVEPIPIPIPSSAFKVPKPKIIVPEKTEEDMPGYKKVRSTEDTCSICYAADSEVRFVGRSCSHGYCGDCARSVLETMIGAGQFPARCPGCRREDPSPASDLELRRSLISADVIEHLAHRAVISVDFAQRFINMQLLKAFDASEIISCPVCTMLNVIDASQRPEGKRKADPTRVQCAECESEFCGSCNCMFKGHSGLNCKQFAARQRSQDEVNTLNLIASTSKPCPNCGMGICHYRGHACHHIRPGTGCPNCGIHFCIVCLERYPCSGKGHGLFCDERCDCPPCPDCRPNRRCPNCDGSSSCPSCQGLPPFGNLPTN